MSKAFHNKLVLTEKGFKETFFRRYYSMLSDTIATRIVDISQINMEELIRDVEEEVMKLFNLQRQILELQIVEIRKEEESKKENRKKKSRR